MNIETMEVSLLKALAHPIRLKIVKKLSSKILCVCELNEDLDFSQSNLSQHLRILTDAGILEKTRDGSRINYNIKNERVIDLLKIVNEIIMTDIMSLQNEIGG